ncbi:MAG: glycosyltransferase family 2 protein [Deltaproteobacteria bacterium]|nr:glycosyltransferase family 2 protein [Deltaproteobacteria bacterium]
MTLKICAIIPAYNAAKTIKSIVEGVREFIPFVMVADDGSMDETAKCASDAGAEVIVVGKNQGKGHALKLLFQRAKDKGYDSVITIDADGQHDPEDIPFFLAMHEQYPEDIIIGSRMRNKSNIPRARYNSMYIARFYISLAANQFIEDTQCGYRLYPLPVFQSISLMTDRYVTETEILMKAGDIGIKVRCIPVKTLYNGGPSYFRTVMDMTAITAYVISFITVKWVIEGLSSNRPFTYSQNRFRDFVSRYKVLDFAFQCFTAVAALPFSILCLVEYIFLASFIKNNFASIRALGKGFHRITIATHMLLVTLLVAVIEKFLKNIGLDIILVDRFLEKSYPNLWEN